MVEFPKSILCNILVLFMLLTATLWPGSISVRAKGIVVDAIDDDGASGAAPAGPGPAGVPDPPYGLTIVRNGSAADLKWYSASDCTDYEVWRGTTPYFDPASGQGNKIDSFRNIWGGNGTVPYTDGGIDWYSAGFDDPLLDPVQVIGNVNINYFWVVRGRDGDSVSDNSNRVGEFDFRLVPGS